MPNVSALVEKFAAGAQPQAAEARQALRELVWHAGSSGAARLGVAQALADELAKPHPPAVQGTLCELLSLVAGAAEVEAIEVLLSDDATREMARWALDRIAVPGAAATLVSAAATPAASFRAGLANSLGRKGANSTAALAKLAQDDDGEVRLAAAEALARIPASEHDAIILAAGGNHARGKKRAAIARVRLAENLARSGQTVAAKTVYQAIAAGDADAPQKKAAQIGLKQLG